jgi:hypothetical protein
MLYSGDAQGMVTGWADEEHHEVERLPRRSSGTFLRMPASSSSSRSADSIPRATSSSSLATSSSSSSSLALAASDTYPLSPRSSGRPSSPTSLHQSVVTKTQRRSSSGNGNGNGGATTDAPPTSATAAGGATPVGRRYSFGLGSLVPTRKSGATSPPRPPGQ